VKGIPDTALRVAGRLADQQDRRLGPLVEVAREPLAQQRRARTAAYWLNVRPIVAAASSSTNAADATIARA
jgi:hypothetical protein